ncbi:TRAP transporter small permease [Zhaonella formicivorans]|uniref:TRAP transporter small permease n=1 Tax=Zhaonella formicivorans TaxID=2528593 RepID=UPI0010DEC7EC|nr:TRAP transporter small permease [Zhaonella formicivorans]
MRKIDKVIDQFEEFVLSASIILMAIILIVNVFFRTVLNSSLTFAEEVGQFLVIVNTFMGISYCAKKARHINMSAVFDLVPLKVKKIFMLVISSLTSVSMFYLAYLAMQYVQKVAMLGRVSPALRIPMEYFFIFVPLGFFTAGIQYARNFIKNIREKDVYLSDQRKFESAGGESGWF